MKTMVDVAAAVCANCCKNFERLKDHYSENRNGSRVFSAYLPPIIPLSSSIPQTRKTLKEANKDNENLRKERENRAQLPITYLEPLTDEFDPEDSLHQPGFVLVNHDLDDDCMNNTKNVNVNIKSEYFPSDSTVDGTIDHHDETESRSISSTTQTITVLDALYEIYNFQWKSRMDLKNLAEKNKEKLCLCNDCSSILSQLFHWFIKFKSANSGAENKAYLYPIVGDTAHFINLRSYDNYEDNLRSNPFYSELNECFVPIIKNEGRKNSGRRKKKVFKKRKVEKESDSEIDTTGELEQDQNNPHKCNACTKAFTTLRGLKLHQKAIHSQNEKLSCPNCGEDFSTLPQFNKHMKSCTKIGQEEILPDLATSNSEFEEDTTDFKSGPSDTEGDMELGTLVSDDDNEKSRKPKRRSRKSRNLSSGKLAVETGPVDCIVCGKTFKNRALFRSHRRIHSTFHNCDYCAETFSDKVSLRLHFNVAHEAEKSFICSICSKAFFTSQQLKKHSANHEEKNVFSCLVCERTFEKETQFKAHQLTHSTEERIPQYKCAICGKKYPSFHLLNSHIRYIHEKRNDFKCDECGKSFGTISYLNAHIVSHSTTGTHLCEICGKNYKHKKDLRIHEFRFHSTGVDRNPHQCPICPKSYFRADHLRIHQVKKNHFLGGEPPEVPAPAQEIMPDENFLASKPFSCEMCGKEYVSELALRTHEVTHSEFPEVPKFCCEQCGRKYLNQKALDYHSKYMHKLKDAHACDTCGKTFGRYSSLKRHQQTHVESAKYTCEECDKSYRNKLDLELHRKREHIGESSFEHECQICQQKFYRKDMLRNHQIRTGHLQVPQYFMLTQTDGSELEVPALDTIEIVAQEFDQEEEELETQQLNQQEIEAHELDQGEIETQELGQEEPELETQELDQEDKEIEAQEIIFEAEISDDQTFTTFYAY